MQKIENLREKAWDTFSIFIRLRDRKCFTCDETFWDEELGEWTIKGLQAGHFRHARLDFDEENINAQCRRCNHYLSGNLAIYAVRLLDKLGLRRFKALNARADAASAGEKLSRENYEAIIKKYKRKIDKIRNRNMI